MCFRLNYHDNPLTGHLPIARLIGVDKLAATNRGYCETKAILSLAILVLVPTIPEASAQGEKLYVFVQTDAAEGVSSAPNDRNYTSRVVCSRGNPLWSISSKAKSARGSLEGYGDRRCEQAGDRQSSARSVHFYATTLQFCKD